MKEDSQDEFYVGYLSAMPPRCGALIRKVLLALAAIAVLLPIGLAAAQQGFGPSVFEFGILREFQGILQAEPYPALQVRRPGAQADWSSYYLVLFGKFGAQTDVEPLAGSQVSLRGELIYRDDQTMIQLAPDSIETLSAAKRAAPSSVQSLGRRTLSGEIVDSKCYLGVMNPGKGKPHRSCASLCIRGGIPPIFLVRDEQGRASYFLLVSSTGEAVNQEILSMVAEPLEISGQVERQGRLLVLKADPATFRRLQE
jgi:hypothetical protein